MQSQCAAFLPVISRRVFNAGALVFGIALAIPAGAASGTAGSGPLALAESERVFLANIEQRGLVLTRRGWPVHVHFGLAGAAKVDKLTVTWPSGLVQEFTDVAGDRHVVIKEGSAELIAHGGAR